MGREPCRAKAPGVCPPSLVMRTVTDEEASMRILVAGLRWWHVAIPLVVVFAGCGPHDGSAAEGEKKEEEHEAHVVVKTEPARLGTLTETVEGLGRCEAIPDHLATLTPAVEGHVHELLVKQGDAVKKGQPIVELDKAVALADLEEKTATRDGLKASLLLLKSIPRPEERRSTELAIEQAKVAVAQAKAAAERLRPLLARREVTEQQSSTRTRRSSRPRSSRRRPKLSSR